MRPIFAASGLATAVLLAACAVPEELPVEREYGTEPALTAPSDSLLPTVNPARAVGWPDGETPLAAPGLTVNAFARNLDHPRWVYVLPNGDVLVAESRGPAKSGGFDGIKGWFAKRMMKYAGAAGVSADRITLLRDADGDGVAELQQAFLTGLHSPIGMALVGDRLYVANTDALVSFPYAPGDTSIADNGEKIVDLPAGELNHHWT